MFNEVQLILDCTMGFTTKVTAYAVARFPEDIEVIVSLEARINDIENDLVRKKKGYEEREIPYYVIVERNVKNFGQVNESCSQVIV